MQECGNEILKTNQSLALKVQQWTVHTDGECGICSLLASQQKGGPPRSEGKNRGRPSSDSPQQLISAIHRQAPPSWKVSQPLEQFRFLPPASNISLADLLCPACNVLWIGLLPQTCWCTVYDTCIISKTNHKPAVLAVIPNTISEMPS